MQSMIYTEELKRRFSDNGGKVFFADGFKNRAFNAVNEIFTSNPVSSTVMVVSNHKVALHAKNKIFSGKEAKIIGSVQDFKKLFADIDGDLKKASDYASAFKRKNPYVIILLKTITDEPVLHAAIGQTEGKRFEYPDGVQSIYTISDFLADAEYSLSIVDNVYDMVDFFEDDAVDKVTPQKFDMIHIMNKCYFTDLAHSYSRLRKLVGSTDKAIIISDTVADRNVISFYAGASLVFNSFYYKKTQKDARGRTNDYDAEIDRVYESISYSEADETIQSICIHNTRGKKQLVPGTPERLGKYLIENVGYMTKEEIFLRTFSVLSKGKTMANADNLISSLDDDNTLGRTICDLFFSDELKGDIESNIEKARLVDMNDEQVATFFKVFQKYAVWCDNGKIGDKCSVYRIYHDDSGFEDLVRKCSEGFDKNENALSASHMGEDASFKSIATKDLIRDGILKTPLLVVSKAPEKQVSDLLQKILDHKVFILNESVSTLDSDSVYVADYSELEAFAGYVPFASGVFFDILPDINLFDTLVKKTLNIAENVNVVLLTTYDNSQGVMADAWQQTWIEENDNLLPIKNGEIYIKGERPFDYRDVIAEIDKLYTSYKKLVDGIDKTDYRSVASNFHSTISGLSLGHSAHADEIEEDFRFLNNVSSDYSNIFSNSVSIGNSEREFYAEVLEKEQGKKKKKNKKNKNKKYVTVEQTSQVAFNICSKQLHETCDFRNSDCFTCPLYKCSIANNFDVFVKNVRGYFKESVKALSKIQAERIERQLDDTIGSQNGTGNLLSKEIENVQSLSKDVDEILSELQKKCGVVSDAPIFADYSNIFDIREAVQNVHMGIFKKYYDQLVEIFEKATKKMKKSFATVGQGAKNSLRTL